MKIVIPDKLELTEPYDSELRSLPGIQVYDDLPDENTLIERIKDAEVVTANFVDITENVINNSPNLKYVIVPAVGYDWVDANAAAQKGIKIINCPTFNSQAVAEHAIGLLFAISRRIVEAHNDVIQGNWRTQIFVGTEVKGKNILVVGNGNIGKKIQNLAKALGMNVDYSDSKTSSEELDNKIKSANFVVLSIPLKEETRGIIDERRLSLFKPTAFLINVGRGLLVEQDALYKYLNEKKIAGAAIDVFPKDETIKAPTEEISRFFKLDNVVGTPHMAFNTKEMKERLGAEIVANLKACLERNPINVVN